MTRPGDARGCGILPRGLDTVRPTEAERRFTALAEGGQVQMPLAKTFFSPRFGMVADRFGVGWMVIVAHPDPAAK